MSSREVSQDAAGFSRSPQLGVFDFFVRLLLLFLGHPSSSSVKGSPSFSLLERNPTGYLSRICITAPLHCWADLVKGDLFFRSNAELRLVSATRRFFHPWRWIHAMRRCTDHWKWVFNLFRETVRLMIRYRISISNRTEGKKSFPAKNQWRRRRRIRFSGRKREGEK